MATFGELQTSVSKRLLDANNTAVSSSDVATALNDAIAYWKFRRFWFNEAEYTSNLTANDDLIPLATDFLLPAYDDNSFFIDYSAMRYVLKKRKSMQFDSQYLSNAFGLPYSYSNLSGAWRCYYIPDQGYSITSRYLKDYAEIEQTNYQATNDFITNAPRLILLWACANLVAELRQDEKMEQYYRAASENEYNQLQVRTAKTNSSGRLRNSSTLI